MVTLYFLIVTASGVVLESGTITARTCAAAIAHAQAALRPHQRLDVDVCVPVETREVRR
jgi:cobalamin biosynthesis protein CbiD